MLYSKSMSYKDNRTETRVRVDKETLQAFQQRYRYCYSRFVRNCVRKAIDDKLFFESVFFSYGD